MDEKYMDGLLNIKTDADHSFSDSIQYHRYEPTPYETLQLLFEQYEMKETDHVVDFGCGKGRFVFYANYYWNAFCSGVERDEYLFNKAMENKERYVKKRRKSKEKIQFFCSLAEEYKIDQLDNIFYFFNPFTSEIFIKVINRILDSAQKNPRRIDILLYYPHEDYIYFLSRNTPFHLEKEIRIPGHYIKDLNERFLIYRFFG